jgi:two-component system, OmpR family, phosphate regulon sensor histidine kinase PhoR
VTFAKRLVAGTVLVLFFTVAILVWTADRSLHRDLRADLARSLEREVRLVREALPADSLAWPVVLQHLVSEDGHRITLIGRDGRVRADTDFPGTAVLTLANHGDRPEVRGALAGRITSAVRRSASVGQDLIYVAAPGGPGVVRVSAALDQADETVSRAQRAILGAAALALLVGSMLALFAARSIAQPLTAIGAAARAIAAGSLPRFPRSGIPDIDALVQALRQMHRQLADRFEELRGEQAGSATLVEAMVEGVIASDGRGEITTANPAARRLLGYGTADPLPGLPQLFRVKAARELVDAAMQGVSIQNRQLELDGRVLLVNARPLPSGGAVLVLHDLTEVRRLEMVRRDFVANVSHELKTPLTSISGYAETLLGDRPDEETTRRFLGTILSNARRMQRLVDDLLDLSRIEAGRWQPEREPVDLPSLARETWAALGERAEASHVTFDVDADPGAMSVVADSDAVRQVLTNLLDNSLRYSSAGGHVTFRTRPLDGGVLLSVSDDGVGIGWEHLPRIFERFYRADASRSRDEGGTGLGLAIVKHLVEAHGGRVWAESERGTGTTVHCWFPAGA